MTKRLEKDVTAALLSFKEWTAKTFNIETPAGRPEQEQNHPEKISPNFQNSPTDPFRKIGLDLAWRKPGPSGNALFRAVEPRNYLRDPNQWINLAEASFAKGDYVGARESLRQATKLNRAGGKTIDGGARDRIIELSRKIRAVPGEVSQKIEAQIQIQTALVKTLTGAERQEAFARLQEWEKSRDTLNLVNQLGDYFQKGIGETPAIVAVRCGVVEVMVKSNWGKELLSEDILKKLEEGIRGLETHLELSPWLKPHLVSHLDQLKLDLEMLREDLKSGDSFAIRFRAQQIQSHLDAMVQPGINYVKVNYLFWQELKIKLASGIFTGNQAVQAEVLDTLQLFQETALLETKQEAAFHSFAAATSGTLSRYDLPKLEDAKLQEHLKDVLWNLKAHAIYDDVKDPDLLEVEYDWRTGKDILQPNVSRQIVGIGRGMHEANFYALPIENEVSLRKHRDEMVRLYGGEELEQIQSELVRQEKAELNSNPLKRILQMRLEDDPGFKLRKATSESLAALKNFDELKELFAYLKEQGNEGVTREMILAVRDEFLNRGEAHQKFLENEIARVRAQEEKYRPRKAVVSRVPVSVSDKKWVSELEQAAAAELRRFEIQFMTEKAKLAGLEWADIPTALTRLEGAREIFAGIEGEHIRGLLRAQNDIVDAIPGNEDQVLRSYDRLARIEAIANQPSVVALQDYEAIQAEIDDVALIGVLKGRIQVLKSYRKEVRLRDRLIGPGEYNATHFTAEELNSKRILDLLESPDPLDKSRGRVLFAKLEQAGNLENLEKEYKSAATFNQWTIGVGIVLAAGLTAGAASGVVGALGGGVLAKGFAMTATFTLSTRIFQGGIYDGFPGVGAAFVQIGKDPLDFGINMATDGAMFLALGGFGRIFSTGFARGMERVAIGRLVARGLKPATLKNLVTNGLIGEGVKLSEGLIVKNPALKKALAQEIAVEVKLLQTKFGVKGLKAGGAFLTEALGFGAFNTVHGVVQMFGEKGANREALSPKDFWEVAQSNFSLKALGHNALFILALKAGGLPLKPVSKFMESRLEKMAFEILLKKHRVVHEKISMAQAKVLQLLQTGQGNAPEILKEYRGLLLERKSTLEKIPPELLHPEALAANEGLLKQAELLQSGIEPWEKIFGPSNKFGTRETENGAIQFAKGQSEVLTAALKQHPWVEKVQSYPNGVIELEFFDPLTGKKNRSLLMPELSTEPSGSQWRQDLQKSYETMLRKYGNELGKRLNLGIRLRVSPENTLSDGRSYVKYELVTEGKTPEIILTLERVFDEGSRSVDLYNIEVSDRYRRQGIAKEIFMRKEPELMRRKGIIFVRAHFKNPLAEKLFTDGYGLDAIDNRIEHMVAWPNGRIDEVTAPWGLEGLEYVQIVEVNPPAFDVSSLHSKRRTEVDAWLQGRKLHNLTVSEQDSLIKHLLGEKNWKKQPLQDLISPEGMTYFLDYGKELPFGFESMAQWTQFQKNLLLELLTNGVPIFDPRIKIVLQGSSVTGRSSAHKKETPNHPYKWEAPRNIKKSDLDIAIHTQDNEVFGVFLERRAKELAALGKVTTIETDANLRRIVREGKIAYSDMGLLMKVRKDITDAAKLGRAVNLAILSPDARVLPKPNETMIISAEILTSGQANFAP